MSKSGRYRGLRPNPQALGVTPLQEGERSFTVRIRGSDDLFHWLQGFTAAQRGELFTELFHQKVPPFFRSGRRREPVTYLDAPYLPCEGLPLMAHPELQEIVDYFDSGGTIKATSEGAYFVIVPGYDIEQGFPVSEAQIQELVKMGWLTQAGMPLQPHRKPSKARATADKGKSTGQKRNNKSTKPISTE